MILHINSYFFTNSIYTNLYSELQNSTKQTVYVPIRKNVDTSIYNLSNFDNTVFVISSIIKKRHRIFYFEKIKTIYEDLINKIDIESVSHVHAHNLFVDGALAYYLNKKYNIPYTISVRMTDVSYQYKFMLHRRGLANSVIKNANSIVNISKNYELALLKLLPESIYDEFKQKSIVIPNGINNDWFEKVDADVNLDDNDVFRFIYVGQIIKRKKIIEVILSISRLRAQGYNFVLDIVGGKSSNEEKYFRKFIKVMSNHNFVKYHGKVNSISHMKTILSTSKAFIMIPKNELFGVVYIEALSQGLPVIYTKGEGISSYLDDAKVGIGVDTNCEKSIDNGIRFIYDNINSFTDISYFANKFNWKEISHKYLKLYK